MMNVAVTTATAVSAHYAKVLALALFGWLLSRCVPGADLGDDFRPLPEPKRYYLADTAVARFDDETEETKKAPTEAGAK